MNINLSTSLPEKLKLVTRTLDKLSSKNAKKLILKISENMEGDTNNKTIFLHKLLLTNR